MTPTEKSLYALTRFRIDDDVIVAGECVGAVTGIRVTTSGEDEYRIFYFDNCNNPQERWIRDSLLESADVNNANVICMQCARAEREATLH